MKGWKESHISQRSFGKGLRLMSYTSPDAGLGELSPVRASERISLYLYDGAASWDARALVSQSLDPMLSIP